MDITFDVTKESFDQLFPQEKQVVVNVLQELHAKYSFFGLQMQVDVPYFFWNMHQTTIFQGVECCLRKCPHSDPGVSCVDPCETQTL